MHTIEYLVITILTKASDNFVASSLNKGHLYLIEMSMSLYLSVNVYSNLSEILDRGCDGISFSFFRLFFWIPHPSGCNLEYLQI